MTPEEVVKHLKTMQERYESRFPDIFGVNISYIAKAAADTIESLLKTDNSTESCIHCNGGRALVIGETNDRGITIQYPNKLIAFGYDPDGYRSNGISCIITHCPMCGCKLKSL